MKSSQYLYPMDVSLLWHPVNRNYLGRWNEKRVWSGKSVDILHNPDSKACSSQTMQFRNFFNSKQFIILISILPVKWKPQQCFFAICLHLWWMFLHHHFSCVPEFPTSMQNSPSAPTHTPVFASSRFFLVLNVQALKIFA